MTPLAPSWKPNLVSGFMNEEKYVWRPTFHLRLLQAFRNHFERVQTIHLWTSNLRSPHLTVRSKYEPLLHNLSGGLVGILNTRVCEFVLLAENAGNRSFVRVLEKIVPRRHYFRTCTRQ